MSLDLKGLVSDYGDPLAEMVACRNSAALFDFSFVARCRLRGGEAAHLIGRLTTRPIADLRPGRIRYALCSDDAGRLLSDVTVWRIGPEEWEVMSGRCSDMTVLENAAARMPGIEFRNLSAESAIVAVQGPAALQALAGLTDTGQLACLPYFGHLAIDIAGIPALVGRLGYTGEAGFELIVPRAAKPELWARLSERARPAGFVAADALRIEAGFLLFANEFQVPVGPAEVGLAHFSGCAVSSPAELALVCLGADDVAIDLPWQPPTPPGRPGSTGAVAVTSACRSAAAGCVLVLAFARRADLGEGITLYDPADRFHGLRRLPLPYYDTAKLRPRQPLRI